jgi:hypothetical protein
MAIRPGDAVAITTQGPDHNMLDALLRLPGQAIVMAAAVGQMFNSDCRILPW